MWTIRRSRRRWLVMTSAGWPCRWTRIDGSDRSCPDSSVLGYDIIIPNGDGSSCASLDERARAVMVEEIHHFMTQSVSAVYPALFGVDGWDSVIARETMRAQCDFWQHPENDCPEDPRVVATVVIQAAMAEFYQQVVVTRRDGAGVVWDRS